MQRCPTKPRLQLAYAFVSEQQWLRGGMTPEQRLEVVDRYEAAIKFPETAFEARMRAARLLFTLGNSDKALEVLDGATRQTSDKELLYSPIDSRSGAAGARPHDEAVAAFRAALATWPGAQSSRVALMTLLVSRGEHDEAASLAEAAQTAGDDEFDPWWTYWLGDFRGYPATLDTAGARPMTRARLALGAALLLGGGARRKPHPQSPAAAGPSVSRRRRRRQRRGVGPARPTRGHRTEGSRLRDPR